MAKLPAKTARMVMARVPDPPHLPLAVAAPGPTAALVEVPHLAAPDTLLVICQVTSTLMTKTPAPTVEEAVTQAIAIYVEAYLRLKTVR